MVSYLDEVLQGLDQGNTYVSPQVSARTPIDAALIDQTIGDQDIAVVILPEAARQEMTSLPEFVRDIASSTSYDTVLVVVGNDFEAGSRVLPSGEASKIANQVEVSYPDISGGAQEFITEVSTQSRIQVEANELPVTQYVVGGFLVTVVAIAATILVKKIRAQRKQNERLSLETLRATLLGINTYYHQVNDRQLAERIRACALNLELLLDRVQESPEAIVQVRADFEQPLQSYYQLLQGHIRVQDDVSHQISDAETQMKLFNALSASTKSLSDVAEDQRRTIQYDSMEVYLEAARSLDYKFPQNIFNGR